MPTDMAVRNGREPPETYKASRAIQPPIDALAVAGALLKGSDITQCGYPGAATMGIISFYQAAPKAAEARNSFRYWTRTD